MSKDRQKALHNGNIPAWRSLKYKVQQEIATWKKSLYKNKLKYLKTTASGGHYQSNVWQICEGLLSSLERDGKIMCQQELGVNQFYVSVNADIPPHNVLFTWHDSHLAYVPRLTLKTSPPLLS